MGRKVVYSARYGGFGISEEGIQWLKDKGLSDDDIDNLEGERHNPLLVEMVEELKDKASADFAALKVAEVSGPYMINEHGGWEMVIEPHHLRWQ